MSIKKGFKFSEESKQKMSQSHKGKPGYWIGKKRSKNDRRRMSVGQQRRIKEMVLYYLQKVGIKQKKPKKVNI